MVLPCVLYASEVVDLRESDMQTMQRQENAAMRRMLQAPKYATIAGMRGEIGISTMKSRVARSRIQYVRRKMQGEVSLIRSAMEEMRARNEEWWKRTRRYMDWAGVEVEELSVITLQEVKRRIAQRVSEEWEAEMQEKSTLWMYRECKTEMKEEGYRGGEVSRLWFRVRTNCLELRDRRRGEEDRSCLICGYELEDLLHFVVGCEALERERSHSLTLKRPRTENGVETVKLFLFGGVEDWRMEAEVLCVMWRARRKRIEEMELVR